jgi:hypothetical protein
VTVCALDVTHNNTTLSSEIGGSQLDVL